MKPVEDRMENPKSKPMAKNPMAALVCLQQAADWLGQYSRILENLNAPASAR